MLVYRVIDANILIDCEVAGLTQTVLSHAEEFVTPKQLFQKELEEDHPNLPNLGLRLEELSEDEEMMCRLMEEKYAGISFNDASIQVLEKMRDLHLITGDSKLKKASRKEGVKVNGTLWLVQHMVNIGSISPRDAVRALQLMIDNDRSLPENELKRITKNLIPNES